MVNQSGVVSSGKTLKPSFIKVVNFFNLCWGENIQEAEV
jgi:hypothetical protein